MGNGEASDSANCAMCTYALRHHEIRQTCITELLARGEDLPSLMPCTHSRRFIVV